MKTIGLLGGMSWESTVTYYQIINTAVKERLGGFHSAKCLLHSVDFAEIEACQAQGDWDRAGELLGEVAAGLERAGADFLLICTNTMHRVAPQIAGRLSIPILHIAEATADELEERGIRTVGLLGTRYTMQQDFYKDKLLERGLQVLVPGEEEMELVNSVIFDELCKGVVSETSKAAYLSIIARLAEHGAQGVILGCTEIGLLVSQEDTSVPLFDTAYIHASRAAALALEI
jgi:aspartate racemase